MPDRTWFLDWAHRKWNRTWAKLREVQLAHSRPALNSSGRQPRVSLRGRKPKEACSECQQSRLAGRRMNSHKQWRQQRESASRGRSLCEKELLSFQHPRFGRLSQTFCAQLRLAFANKLVDPDRVLTTWLSSLKSGLFLPSNFSSGANTTNFVFFLYSFSQSLLANSLTSLNNSLTARTESKNAI